MNDPVGVVLSTCLHRTANACRMAWSVRQLLPDWAIVVACPEAEAQALSMVGVVTAPTRAPFAKLAWQLSAVRAALVLYGTELPALCLDADTELAGNPRGSLATVEPGGFGVPQLRADGHEFEEETGTLYASHLRDLRRALEVVPVDDLRGYFPEEVLLRYRLAALGHHWSRLPRAWVARRHGQALRQVPYDEPVRQSMARFGSIVAHDLEQLEALGFPLSPTDRQALRIH
jgi:hypothetical protein